MSMLSAITLAILLLASCSKNASELSFHDAREALDAQKVFLSRMKSDKDLSMEHLADKISKWRTLEDSVSACLMRDTIKKAFLETSILSHKNLGTSVNVKQGNMPLLPTDIIIVGMTGPKGNTPTADGLHHAMP